MEADGRGTGGDNGLVAGPAGTLERGNDKQPGAETTTAHGDRIGAGRWDYPRGRDRGADSLALRHHNDPQWEADCTWRMLAEDAGRRCFADSQTGAAAYLRRNRRGVESRRAAQCVWPALYE